MPIQDGQLRFRADGTFRIVCFSDFQETYEEFDPRTLRGVNAVLDAEQPDFVILCGDNCNGPRIRSAAELEKYLSRMLEPFVRRNLPWCHVNGNHDYDAAVPMDEQMRIYAAVPGCMTQNAPGIPGSTNFALPVYSADGERIVCAVWGLDTGHDSDDVRPGLIKEALAAGLSHPASNWGMIRFEQLMWYWNRSLELERGAGHAVPGVMAMHVAPWEFDYMRRFTGALGVTGNTKEQYGLGALNSGVFAALVQRGDVKCVLSGHTHMNTCSARYCGIEMCNVGSAGYSAYGEDALRGCRVIDLSAENSEKIITRMAYFDDYV